MPTHDDIQRCLVELNDKPREFIGSKQWIGSFELSSIINKMLNVECKLLYLADGADVIDKLEDFKEHFLTQGTPIMIGGGVLAFTMLGVSINEEDLDAS